MGEHSAVAPAVMAVGGGILLGLVVHQYTSTHTVGLVGVLGGICGFLLFVWGILLLLGKHSYARKVGFRAGKASAVVILLLLIIIGFFAYVAWHGKLSVINGNPLSIGGSRESTGGRVSLQLPIKFVFRDELTGATTNPSNAYLVNTKGYVVETLTVSNGAAVTSGIYVSGQSFYLKVYSTSSIYYFVPVTLPYYDARTAKIKAPDYHLITVNAFTAPSSLSIKVINATGNAVTSISGAAPKALTVMVVNSAANTELPPEFYNPITKSRYGNYLVITVTGSGSVLPRVSGAELVFKSPGTAVYAVKLGRLAVRVDPRTNMATPATQNVPITIDPTGVPNGSYSIKISAYVDLDESYLKSYGVANNDAVELGSATLTLSVS